MLEESEIDNTSASFDTPPAPHVRTSIYAGIRRYAYDLFSAPQRVNHDRRGNK